MKNAVFLDVTPCGTCKDRRFGGKYTSIIRVKRVSELGTSALVTAKLVPISLILFTFMMKAICSSETSFLIRHTRRHIPEYDTPPSLLLTEDYLIFDFHFS
jgi:hypothetical protein